MLIYKIVIDQRMNLPFAIVAALGLIS